MKSVMAVRQEIADHWHDRTGCRTVLFASDDAFAAFYTSKFLIQDTAEAVDLHMETGFSSNALAAYIEFWGVMQALVIQQDAITELHKSIFGSPPVLQKPSSWFDVRELRNRCAGHPAKANNKGATLRSFMGRTFGQYTCIQYEQYNSATEQTTHPTFDLKSLIHSYDAQAASVPSTLLGEIKKKCP
jgi:hypothetical protein